MTRRRTIGVGERRARIGIRHRLATRARAPSVAQAAASVVALHATDPASVFLQARARMAASSPAGIERELHEERSALRMMAMRRTLFLVAAGDVALIHAAASRAIADAERKRTLAMLADAGLGPAADVLLRELEAAGLALVHARGEATTTELTALDPRLGHRMTVARGKSYEGTISVSQKVFFHLALDGKIGRGRPRGTWIGSQSRWRPIEAWLPEGIAEIPVDDARAELVRRWLGAFGPGTRDDIRWWTGWTVAAVKGALAAVGAVEVDLDGGEVGYALPGDAASTDPPDPWVALLPALDATTMGWAGREWYLGPHRPTLFDRNGNAGPTIWADGRVIGGWAQRKTGEVVWRLLEDAGAETTQAIEREAACLQRWLGQSRFSTSFPTPLEAELRR